MRGSNLLPKQLRSLGKSDSWLNRTITSNLIAISTLACGHPIHTIVAIALLASTSYVGLLQESLFDSGLKSLQHNGRVDVEALLRGSRTLELSRNTAWKWQFPDDSSVPSSPLVRLPSFTRPLERTDMRFQGFPPLCHLDLYFPRLFLDPVDPRCKRCSSSN
jgi:hydroxymethylglutaryl-CoA reductase (NADPH)